MKVLIAQHSGFCEGVERAYRLALEQSKAGKPVFMLGNLVHNKQVVAKLTEQGIKTVASLAEVPPGANGILLIPAHGVAPEIYAAAKKLELEIIDTTCPWVKKAQKIARELAAEGRSIIIIGDKGHPEVQALVGWSNGQGKVIEQREDLQGFSAQEKVGVLAQTTQAEQHFTQMVAEIKKLVKDVKEYNTICGATAKRQKAAVDLAKKVDLMLVIGDTMSANTKRLTELCRQTGTATRQIQAVSELKEEWLVGHNIIGVTAGASTPEWVIQEVIALLRAR